MLAVMYFVTALVMLVNTVIVTLYVSWWGLSGLVLAGLFLYLTHSSSKLEKVIKAEGWELGEGLDIENPDRPKKVNVVLEDEALNLGLLFIGGPKSGKSIAAIGCLQYLCTERKGGWCYWDGKGDLEIYQQTVACGAEPDRFFSSELENSDTTNVFSGETENVIDRITRAMISDDSEYYGNAQRSTLRKIVPLLKALDMPTALTDLYVFLLRDDAAMYVMNLAQQQGVKPSIIESARLYLAIEEKDRKDQINGLLNRMDLFVGGRIGERLNAYAPTLDLMEASKQGQKIYLHLPDSQLARDVATMLTEEIGEIAKQRQLYETNRTPWPQIYDDWGSFFYDNFGPITARCRSAKMPVSFLFQSRGQTDRVEGGRVFTTEITDNIGGLVILRINGEDSAEWAANQFGKFDTHELARTDSTQYEGNNLTTIEKPRVRSDGLRNMNAGEAYINCLITGEKGKVANKRYKARFPLPDFTGANDVSWPVINVHNNDDQPGLHLWRDFMNKERLRDLKKKVAEESVSPSKSNKKKRKDEVSFL